MCLSHPAYERGVGQIVLPFLDALEIKIYKNFDISHLFEVTLNIIVTIVYETN